MDTPGTEPILTVAVAGDTDAPVHGLARAIARRVKERHGAGAVPYLHPQLEGTSDHLPYSPWWALLRQPTHLVGLAAMAGNGYNLHDIAWGLHQTDAVLLAVAASRERAEMRARLGLHHKLMSVRDLMLLAAHRGLDGVIVFLDTSGCTAERGDEAERELRLTLMLAGLPGDDLTVIRGTVDDPRSIDQTLDAIARDFRMPAWDAEGPLRMVVRAAGPDGGRGRITSGRLVRGQKVTRTQDGMRREVRVLDIRRFGHPLDEAAAGQNVAVALEEVENEALDRGAVIADMEGVKLATSFRARVTFFRTEDGGRSRYVMSGFVPSFLLPSVQRKARIELLDRERAFPGETFPVRATFPDGRAEYVSPGDLFVLRRDGRIIGNGVVE